MSPQTRDRSQAAKVLAADMHLNMALPCRISVCTEKNETKIAQEVEEATSAMKTLEILGRDTLAPIAGRIVRFKKTIDPRFPRDLIDLASVVPARPKRQPRRPD